MFITTRERSCLGRMLEHAGYNTSCKRIKTPRLSSQPAREDVKDFFFSPRKMKAKGYSLILADLSLFTLFKILGESFSDENRGGLGVGGGGG